MKSGRLFRNWNKMNLLDPKRNLFRILLALWKVFMEMASNTRKQSEMNGMDYLVDTSILIYTLDGTIDPSRFEPGNWFYFFISEIELSGKPGLTGEQLSIIKDALSICQKAHYHNQIVYSGQSEPLNPVQSEPVIPEQSEPL